MDSHRCLIIHDNCFELLIICSCVPYFDNFSSRIYKKFIVCLKSPYLCDAIGVYHKTTPMNFAKKEAMTDSKLIYSQTVAIGSRKTDSMQLPH